MLLLPYYRSFISFLLTGQHASAGPEEIITISYFISANLMSDGESDLEFVTVLEFRRGVSDPLSCAG
jgi:hypothetical protein